MQDVFERIYKGNVWGNAESRSGDGSDEEATAAIRAVLPDLFGELNVKSILDVPCGDFNWMRLLDPKIDYVGGDIVAEVIASNRRVHARAGRDFQVIDITKDPLPHADLVLCRDLFVHLSYADIQAAFANIVRSGARYLLATTFPSRGHNTDIKTGAWRPLNLQRPPFSLQPPLRLIDERCTEWDGYWADKSLGLWDVEVLRPGNRSGRVFGLARENSPRVSIVIPTYNRAHFIDQAVASALGQSYSDLEVIVVDDGSTDATPEVLASFDDPRLVCIRQDNRGRSRARNLAIERARGTYIAFLDSDDYYLPSKIEQQVAFLEANPDFGMVYTAATCVGEDGQLLGYAYHAPVSGWIYPHIVFFKPLTVILPSVMVRRDILLKAGYFDEAMVRFEDTDMWRRIAKITRIAGFDTVTCHIRTHSGNRLEAMDPAEIATAIEYYIEKVIREDAAANRAVVNAGARRLFEHYAAAMMRVPAFADTRREFQEKGRGHFQPLVSIVIPVYNGANYLGLAIESALAQTYPNIEVVVVNDGSTDDGATEGVARRYGDRIRYFTQPNGGVAAALNRAVSEARGEYISWLSHDDLYTADKIERQIARLVQEAEPDRCILYGDFIVFTRRPYFGRTVEMPHVEPEDFRFFITSQNILHGCTLLIPKAAFERHGNFNERLRTTQDYDLWFRMAAEERFVHLPGVVVKARSHDAQGTIAMRDLVIAEANELLSRFVEALTPDQVERGTSSRLVLGYLDIAASFQLRNFHSAAITAAALAKRAAQTIFCNDHTEARTPLQTNTDAAVDPITAFVAEAEKRAIQRAELMSRCKELTLYGQGGSVERSMLRLRSPLLRARQFAGENVPGLRPLARLVRRLLPRIRGAVHQAARLAGLLQRLMWSLVKAWRTKIFGFRDD